MGILRKPAKGTIPSALGDDFAKSSDPKVLDCWKRELEKALKEKKRDKFTLLTYESRLDYIDQWTWELKKAERHMCRDPWNWPGPVAPPKMKAVRKGDGTYIHATTTEPRYQGEESEKGDMTKIMNWAVRCGVDKTTAFAHLGGIRARVSTKFQRSELVELQHKIAAIAKKRHNEQDKKEPKKVGLLTKKREQKKAPEPEKLTEQLKEAIDKKEGEILDQAKMFELAAARERLGIHPDSEIFINTREQAENVLKDRNLAILELSFIEEQYLKAKAELRQLISDISLVYDEALEPFFHANNPTKKKSWSLQYGDLKVRNRPWSASISDEDQLQPELERILKKDPELAEKLGIKPVKRFTRDAKAISEYIKQKKKDTGSYPALAGIKVKEAKENVFSIAPSLDVIKKNITKEMQEKGLK